MEVVEASWKQGFATLHGNADAQKVADEIISIGESATPEQILEKARNENTELHRCFEWRDDVAAEKYRIQQARQIVCHLVIKKTVKEDKPPIRFFAKTSKVSGYEPVRVIVRNEEKYQGMLLEAYKELKAFKNKYINLKELEHVFESIDELMN